MENPLKYFAELTDPRVERNREHLLEEILLMAIAAVLSGAESWNDIKEYGQSKRKWLKTFLTLPAGIPSHDRKTPQSRLGSLLPATVAGNFICAGLPSQVSNALQNVTSV
jgi:hypothetical protein